MMNNIKIKKKSGISYKTRYSQLRDHLDYFLGEALDDIYAPLTIEEIKERLRNVTNVNISVSTLKKDLKKFFSNSILRSHFQFVFLDIH